MAQFRTFAPDVEVKGDAMLSLLDGMGTYRTMAKQFLSDNDIVDLQAGRWYSQQAWLDAFRNIHDSVGPTLLFTIGTKIPHNAQFPKEIDDLEKALQAIDVAYHMNHRIAGKSMFDPATGRMLEGIGHYGYEKTGDRIITMTCRNPYPCDFDRGIIDAMAKMYKPAGSLFIKVKHDDERPCRKRGGDACTYRVEW